MRILVIGASGQVAQSLVERAKPLEEVSLVALGRPDTDLGDEASIQSAIEKCEPEIVVNCAAYTQVDKAEAEPDLAFTVNRDGAGRLADGCARHGLPFIHLSTDYVFDGRSDTPYCEDDATNPLGVYGRSKLEGEQAVAAANGKAVILRTAWVHSPYGGNFVKTMLRLGAERDEVRVVADQTGCPTYAPHLADLILAAARHIAVEGQPLEGVFHAAGSGTASWFELSREVFAQVSALGGKVPELTAIGTADYATPAERPRYSVLNCDRISSVLGTQLPHWTKGVAECVRRLMPAGREQTS